MKIAILSPFYPFRGGIAQFSDRLYQELVKEHEVKAFSYSTLYPKLFFPGKSQLVPNPVSNLKLPSERILSSVNPSTFSQTATAINMYKPDVLIVAYWMPYMAVALSRVCKKVDKSIKIVGLVHNALPHESSLFNKPLASLFFKRCDAFITMSESVKNDLLTLGATAPIMALEHPIYDHYPEVSDKYAVCDEFGLKENKKTLLFFGLIRSYKGLDLLIEAMGHLDDSYNLIIAGECYGSFSSYQQLINLSKNRGNIKVFQHYISDDMVSKLFSVADVLVLPYRSATQSGVIAVAYQLEVPVIATNVGALGQAVQSSKTGVVVAEVAAKALSEGIEEFFQGEYKTIYSESLKKEKARLSWSSFTTSVKLFIADL